MDYFLIFSYEILKPQTFFLFFRVDSGQPCNPGPGFLAWSTPGSGLLTMIRRIFLLAKLKGMLHRHFF